LISDPRFNLIYAKPVIQQCSIITDTKYYDTSVLKTLLSLSKTTKECTLSIPKWFTKVPVERVEIVYIESLSTQT